MGVLMVAVVASGRDQATGEAPAVKEVLVKTFVRCPAAVFLQTARGADHHARVCSVAGLFMVSVSQKVGHGAECSVLSVH
jgi:hypothetical protein